ncbi:5'-deoxyadenosine deaminase [Candidatus Methanobinarius endosymbioticus]|uniref:5'-deoxyadenosine deaminase n=1 Tax=Candidatus Methanobinarius endosymbioticus TaxID=2006182 RepID=A0A366MDF3_9EURY|nr:5'-deoxyadenosine deaminase [Candidatus Methanobinarius endosymbioticus]
MITIANGTVLYGNDLVAKNTNILIDKGKIIEISPNVSEGEILDATDCIVCPSFLNAHTHIGDSIVKDIGDGKSIEEIVKPPNGLKHLALQEASNEEIMDSMEESMWDMLETGTTHFIDYREGGLGGVKLLRKASKNVPLNPIILGRDDSFYGENPDLAKVKIAIRKLLKVSDGIAPSGFGEITIEVANLIVEKCQKADKISSIHAGEYENLQLDSLSKTGKTEINKAVDSGFDQLIHIVSPMENDLELIKKYNKNIVLCPGSNGLFSLGVPPLFKMLEKGIRPLIGTDNIMINSSNMFRELEYTLKVMRAISKKYISPKEILKMGTTNINTDYNQNNCSKLINKSIIEENSYAELFVSRKISKNPYLSLINRSEKKDMMCLINKDKLIYYD